MQASTRLGFGIAALFAAGVFVVYLFGDHSSWFTRAAQGNAVRCMTEQACPRLTLQGPIVTSATPPLTTSSRCAKAQNWHEVKGVPNALTRLTVTCSDGDTYLYHMGKLANPAAANEQWMVCAEPDCKAETRLLASS